MLALGPVKAKLTEVTVLLAPTSAEATVPCPDKLTVSPVNKLLRSKSELSITFVPSYCLLPVMFTDKGEISKVCVPPINV